MSEFAINEVLPLLKHYRDPVPAGLLAELLGMSRRGVYNHLAQLRQGGCARLVAKRPGKVGRRWVAVR